MLALDRRPACVVTRRAFDPDRRGTDSRARPRKAAASTPLARGRLGPNSPGRATDGRHMRVVSGIQATGNLHLGNYLGCDQAVGGDAGSMRRTARLLLPRRSPCA